jgi:hypothetical protein
LRGERRRRFGGHAPRQKGVCASDFGGGYLAATFIHQFGLQLQAGMHVYPGGPRRCASVDYPALGLGQKKRCTCGLPGRRRRSDNHFPVGCPPSRGTSNSADQGADALVPAILREVTLAPERGKADTLADVPETTF